MARVRRSWTDVLVAALVTMAVAVRLRGSWTPLGDNALLEMWTQAVGTTSTPLVGGDARFGWNHLGPWLFWILAIPYRLLGSSAVGLLVGAAAINIVSIVVIGRIVRRVAGQAASLVVTAGALLFLAVATGNRLVDPWNPNVAQLPLMLAIVACWAVINGQQESLPWLIGAGSFCVQCHITFVGPVAVLTAFAAVHVARGLRSSGSSASTAAPGSLRSALRWTAIVTMVAWLPALIDLGMPHGHNLYRVARYFARGSTGSKIGLRRAVRALLRETGLSSEWLGGRPGTQALTDAFDGRVGLLPGLGVGMLVVAAVVSIRTRDRVSRSLVMILSALLAGAVIELSVGSGQLFPYLFGWVTVVGMMCVLAVFIVGARARPDSATLRLAPVLPLFISGVLVATGVGAASPSSPRERSTDVAIVRSLAREASSHLDRTTSYRLSHGADHFNSIYEHGIVNALRKDGFRIVVEPTAAVLFGRQMTDERALSYPRLQIFAPFVVAPGGSTVVALSDPLTPAERAEEANIVETLVAEYEHKKSRVATDIVFGADGNLVLLAAFESPDPLLDPLLRRLAELRMRGRSIAVVVTQNAA
jgi:hypothetical protein